MIIERTEVKVGTLQLTVVHLKQKDIGITVREELGHFLLIDANDSPEMFLMSSLFKHVNDTNDVVFLQRENQFNADLVIFNGAVNPLGRKMIKEIKSIINHNKPRKFELAVIRNHDEAIWDKWESWKYEKQLKIHADSHLAMLNTSKLGFEFVDA
ncbi:hypothetical protein PALU110988_05405 [Paenibacillus lupini]|uniref:hypothetical protein n=1 Tax=Paenibacillus lupini TaxID=1450204 RepID=UPI00141EF3D2|nr:hypothetical protein [Paenibacillus lupini]NIK25260.1 hypothetical protein [Paenibacillus lupini]